MRILFADDHEEIRILTAQQLERSGHYVFAVSNGRDVLSALLREHFDVVLLDEEMPVMGGVQVAHAIRENEARAGNHAFLIALTGNCREEDVARLCGEGFDAVLEKPFRLEALNSTLDSADGARALTPALNRPPSANSVAVDELLERIGGDKKLLRQMIRTFLSDTPKRITALEGALQRNNAEQTAFLAHALKGSLGIFLAQRALERARELESLSRKAELSGAESVFAALKEEIAKLEENLRGYAVQTQGKRSRPAAKKTKRASGKHKQ